MSEPIEFRPPNVRLNLSALPFIPVIIVGALMALLVFVWFFCRIEPGAGQIAVLIRKTGENLQPGQVIAVEEGQKGQVVT